MNRFTLKYIVFLIVIVFYSSLVAQPIGYEYGKQYLIQASQVSGTGSLTDFPILISVVDNDLRTQANGGRLYNNNGYDIYFTSSDCSTKLDHQIEEYSASTGELVVWVKVPSLSGTTNTNIHMYYGNSSISMNSSVNSTWNSGYETIYHFNRNDFNDGTANNNDATNSGSNNRANAKIAGGRRFATSSGNYVEVDMGSVSNSVGTVELWGLATSFSSAHQYFFGHTSLPAYNNRIQLYTDDAGGNLDLGLGNSHTLSTGIQTLSSGQWYHIALTWNSGTYRVYVDGVQRATGSYAGLSTITGVADLGNEGNPSARNEELPGRIDEVRLSTVERSGDLIATSHTNQDDPSSFYVVSSEFTGALLCSTLPVTLVDFSAERQPLDNVLLKWSTATEINNDYFTLEKSENGTIWTFLGKVNGQGNTSQKIDYTFLDTSPYNKINYYRLKQTDFNGDAEIFPIIVLHSDQKQFLIYPNPAKTSVTIPISNSNPTNFELLNVMGQNISSLTSIIMINEQEFQLDISNLPKGIYFIHSEETRLSFVKM